MVRKFSSLHFQRITLFPSRTFMVLFFSFNYLFKIYPSEKLCFCFGFNFSFSPMIIISYLKNLCIFTGLQCAILSYFLHFLCIWCLFLDYSTLLSILYYFITEALQYTFMISYCYSKLGSDVPVEKSEAR